MSAVPDEIESLVRERESARASKDYARADMLRAEIEAAGYVLRDTPEGPVAELKPRYDRLDPRAIPNKLHDPPAVAFSFHVLYEGFSSDLERFLSAFARHHARADAEVVVVDNGSSDGEKIHDTVAPFSFARAVHLDREVGWASARNAGLRAGSGSIIVLVDLAIEPVGDICAPLGEVFADPSVGIAGPFGLVTEDMREWSPADAGEAHAIEGYLLATRRELLADEQIREKFTWYRNADLDLSLQIRARGTRAVVVDLPVVRHEHRGWEALGDEERADLSRRNHAILLERWRGRSDLLG